MRNTVIRIKFGSTTHRKQLFGGRRLIVAKCVKLRLYWLLQGQHFKLGLIWEILGAKQVKFELN